MGRLFLFFHRTCGISCVLRAAETVCRSFPFLQKQSKITRKRAVCSEPRGMRKECPGVACSAPGKRGFPKPLKPAKKKRLARWGKPFVYAVGESSAEHVLLQPVESFLHPRKGQSQVHADVAGAVESPAVLPSHAHIPAGVFQGFDGGVVFLAPLGAV